MKTKKTKAINKKKAIKPIMKKKIGSKVKLVKKKIIEKQKRKYTKKQDKNTSLSHPYKIGEKYFIRTVTMYFTGRLLSVYEQELVLGDCSWIADTGRYHNALKDGALSEIEPIPSDNIIGRGAIIDCCVWNHELPMKQK